MAKTTKKPAFDPLKLLVQLQGIVSKQKTASTKDGKSSGKSWVGTLIIIITVLVGVAVWSWISWSRGRELAKLRHEKNKKKILIEYATLMGVISENAVTVSLQQKIFDKADRKLKIIEADIRAEEKRYEADMRAIDNMRSWRDAGVR